MVIGVKRLVYLPQNLSNLTEMVLAVLNLDDERLGFRTRSLVARGRILRGRSVSTKRRGLGTT